MISLLLVLPAFGLMFLSDRRKLAGRRKQGKALFLSGIAVLAAAGVTAAVNGPRFQAAPLLKAFFLDQLRQYPVRGTVPATRTVMHDLVGQYI